MTPDFENFLMHLPAGLFVPDGNPVSAGELAGVRHVLPGLLPDSYRAFVSIIGPGYWINDSGFIKPPSDLYAFDLDCWEMEGFVALVENAAGVGDHIAFNPADPPLEGERPMYYCGHDPFSCVRAADTFEAWVYAAAQTPLSGKHRYEHLDGARADSYRRFREHEKGRTKDGSPRRWWQLWR